MKKFSVSRVGGTDGFGVYDVRGNRVGNREFEHRWEAEFAGVHWACAKPLFSRLGFKPVNTGSNNRAWEARPFYGIHAIIVKHPQTKWIALVTVADNPVDSRAERFKTRTEAAKFVSGFGDGMVMTRNILNRDAGEFPIARRDKGGCTDPGTETYHCM